MICSSMGNAIRYVQFFVGLWSLQIIFRCVAHTAEPIFLDKKNDTVNRFGYDDSSWSNLSIHR
jgi:hypothetical protein